MRPGASHCDEQNPSFFVVILRAAVGKDTLLDTGNKDDSATEACCRVYGRDDNLFRLQSRLIQLRRHRKEVVGKDAPLLRSRMESRLL